MAALSVQLHPLVLLTISDHINRHILRQQQYPVLGAVIGQADGRQYTLEHAFECRTAQGREDVTVDADWFSQRLEAYKEVHKKPQQLDLVAMYMIGPTDGPQDVHVPVLKQIRGLTGNDSVLLLLFHGEMVDKLQGGKLPITLYETEGDAEIKFNEVNFEVETGEAEMIGVDTVAKQGGTALAVSKSDGTAQTAAADPSSSKRETKSKGKGKGKDKDADDETSTSVLSPEDDELIASLTAKANAIKMLNQRINVIRNYLGNHIPASYLTDSTSKIAPPDNTNHALLRSINSMLSRIPLLSPPTPSNPQPTNGDRSTPLSTPSTAGNKERADVHLTSLLAALSRSVSEAQSMGSKFHIVSREKASKDRSGGGSGWSGGNFGGGYGNGGGRGGRGFAGFGDEGVEGGTF